MQFLKWIRLKVLCWLDSVALLNIILKNTTFQQVWPGIATENQHGAGLQWQFRVGDTRQGALMGRCVLLCASRAAQASPALCCAGTCSQAVGLLPPLHCLSQQTPAWGESPSKTHLSIKCNNAKTADSNTGFSALESWLQHIFHPCCGSGACLGTSWWLPYCIFLSLSLKHSLSILGLQRKLGTHSLKTYYQC